MNFMKVLGIFALSVSICCFPFAKWNDIKREKNVNSINHVYVDSDWVAEDTYNKMALARKMKRKNS